MVCPVESNCQWTHKKRIRFYQIFSPFIYQSEKKIKSLSSLPEQSVNFALLAPGCTTTQPTDPCHQRLSDSGRILSTGNGLLIIKQRPAKYFRWKKAVINRYTKRHIWQTSSTIVGCTFGIGQNNKVLFWHYKGIPDLQQDGNSQWSRSVVKEEGERSRVMKCRDSG